MGELVQYRMQAYMEASFKGGIDLFCYFNLMTSFWDQVTGCIFKFVKILIRYTQYKIYFNYF